jgi:hypothetical protein
MLNSQMRALQRKSVCGIIITITAPSVIATPSTVRYLRVVYEWCRRRRKCITHFVICVIQHSHIHRTYIKLSVPAIITRVRLCTQMATQNVTPIRKHIDPAATTEAAC